MSDQALPHIWEYMKEFSFNILGKAIYDCTFNEMSRPFAHTLAVVQAAHGAELLIKARIAKEHPLLIFDKLPKPTKENTPLELEQLIENTTTIKFSDLPDRLWVTTGIQMDGKTKNSFIEFGNLRNKIIHFGFTKEENYDNATLRFIFEIMDPLSHALYGETFVEYAADWDDVIISEGYLEERLEDIKIDIHPQTLIALKKSADS